MQFEDGFWFYLPANRLAYEVTEEMLAGGVFFLAGTEDMAYSCTVGRASLGGDAFTIEEVYDQFLLVFPHANLLQVNGVYIVTYQDFDRNTLNCVAWTPPRPAPICSPSLPATMRSSPPWQL